MCFSHNFIEQQAYEMSEKIKENTIFKFVKVECVGGSTPARSGHLNELAMISKVILEDDNGIIYSVEPSLEGLRFAKGEISYKEYKKLQKREDFNGYALFFVIISFFSLFLIVMRYLIER